MIRPTQKQLMEYVGKRVEITFKDGVSGDKIIKGILGYTFEFSNKYNYRIPHMFFIDHLSFRSSYVKKVEAI